MNKIQLIEHTFNEIDKQFEFITLRNFHLIPEQSSRKNDIDILILKNDSKRFIEFMSGMGYQISYDYGSTEFLYGADSHIHCVDNKTDVHFDVVTGLYYRSLQQRNLFIGGFEELEQSMWKNKKKASECYRHMPSTEDLLTHLCCHAIFDKAEITPVYGSLIEDLYPESNKEKLKELFTLVFYKAADHLLSVIEAGKALHLVKKYVQFSHY